MMLAFGDVGVDQSHFAPINETPDVFTIVLGVLRAIALIAIGLIYVSAVAAIQIGATLGPFGAVIVGCVMISRVSRRHAAAKAHRRAYDQISVEVQRNQMHFDRGDLTYEHVAPGCGVLLRPPTKPAA
jgi:uncharacterized membrane protein YedE/YeeE